MLLCWCIRFFVFKLHESPKYLMGHGKDEEAVDVVHKVAAYNGKTTSLTARWLRAAGGASEKPQGVVNASLDMSAKAILRRKLNINHASALFATRKLALSTSLLILIWGAHNIPILDGGS